MKFIEYLVPQKYKQSGCITTGYEIILRATKFTDIDFEKFQDEFDFDKNRNPSEPSMNNFQTISSKITNKYPKVQFEIKTFSNGKLKIDFLKTYFKTSNLPILCSVSNKVLGSSGGYHIMPILDIKEDTIVFFYFMKCNNQIETKSILIHELISAHDCYDGGKDISYLKQ